MITTDLEQLLQDANAEIEFLKQCLDKKQVDLNEANKLVERLMDTLAQKVNETTLRVHNSNPLIPSDVVNIDGDNYRFVKPGFTLKGVSYKSKEVLLNTNVLNDLVAIKGQRVLEKL